jgi:hypothetical protein
MPLERQRKVPRLHSRAETGVSLVYQNGATKYGTQFAGVYDCTVWAPVKNAREYERTAQRGMEL